MAVKLQKVVYHPNCYYRWTGFDVGQRCEMKSEKINGRRA